MRHRAAGCARRSRRWRLVFVAVSTLTLSSCVGLKLKTLEIRHLREESASISTSIDFLDQKPTLGDAYEGRLFISGIAFNTFLQGLDNYTIALSWPKGAVIRFLKTRLDFKDGPPHALIDAKAIDASGNVEVNLRVGADLLISANPDKSLLEVRFAVTDVIPDIRFSIFRWRQFWLGVAVLTIQVQKYFDSMPLTEIPLTADLPITIDPSPTGRIDVNNGQAWIDVDQTLPHFGLAYTYIVTRVVTLQDGIHVFSSCSQGINYGLRSYFNAGLHDRLRRGHSSDQRTDRSLRVVSDVPRQRG
jgi:hypothetical protein